MGEGFAQLADDLARMRQKRKDNSGMLFHAGGSAGRNPVKLARILVAWDMVISMLKLEDKPLANLTKFVVSYQASIDAKYHDDFKEVQIAEEIERRREERKGISVMQG